MKHFIALNKSDEIKDLNFGQCHYFFNYVYAAFINVLKNVCFMIEIV